MKDDVAVNEPADAIGSLLERLEASAIAARRSYREGRGDWNTTHLTAVTTLAGKLSDEALRLLSRPDRKR